jgi:hypothetical protein
MIQIIKCACGSNMEAFGMPRMLHVQLYYSCSTISTIRSCTLPRVRTARAYCLLCYARRWSRIIMQCLLHASARVPAAAACIALTHCVRHAACVHAFEHDYSNDSNGMMCMHTVDSTSRELAHTTRVARARGFS